MLSMNNKSVRFKLLCVTVIGILLPIIVLLGIYFHSMNATSNETRQITSEKLLDEVKNTLQFTVESVITSMEALYREQSGKMPESQLQALIRRELAAVRFGESGYFFAYQYDGIRLVAPENPAQEGKNLWDITDKNGVKLVQELLKQAKNGGGFFTYVWLNPKTQKEEDKISYATPIKLGSVEYAVGTGTYIPQIAAVKAEIAAKLQQNFRANLILIVVISLVLLTSLLFVTIKLTDLWITTPVKQLMKSADKLALGDVEFNFETAVSRDEIGMLTASFGKMVENIREHAKVAEKVALGNLDVEVKARSEKDVLARSLKQVVTTLKDLVKETGVLTNAAAEGRLNLRGDSEKFSGGYREIVMGINRTLEVIIAPLSEAEATLSKMAVNDFTGAMTGEYQGMLKQFAESINQVRNRFLAIQDIFIQVSKGDTSQLEQLAKVGQQSKADQIMPAIIKMMSTIQALIEEIRGLNEATLAGRLKERGRVERFEGGYQSIIAGLNQTLDVLNQPIAEALTVLQEMAQGNLQVSMQGEYRGDLGILKDAINRMLTSFNMVLADIDKTAEQVAVGSRHLSESSQLLSQGASEQASTIEQISASITEIASQIKQNAVNASQANELTAEGQAEAGQGNVKMQAMLKSMDEINESSRSISKVIKVIDEIAFQTNILALNAAVEAARAGQYGKGFAVVAEEVRNLAARSANAAKETTALIEGSIKKVETGTQMAHETAGTFRQIVDATGRIAELIAQIAVASNEQATGISQINLGISQVSQVTQSNTSVAEESAAASEELSSQADLLQEAVSRFKINDGSLFLTDNEGTTRKKADLNSTRSAESNGRRFQLKLDDQEFSKY